MNDKLRFSPMSFLSIIFSISISSTLTANQLPSDDSALNQATIIGKVFFDSNMNGYLDTGEEGIPGVRLATVTGLVVETDAYGRFHIPDGMTSNLPYGQNQLLKVDKASLPQGAKMTTENPRLIRLSNVGMNKVNFGIAF